MDEHWLIDGYNLLHALGFAPRDERERALENARRRLLRYLKDALGDTTPPITVVFDATAAQPGIPAAITFHRIHVRFAVGYEEADDLIEQLIRECPSPRHLHVVSDDQRLQKAARKRDCVAHGCLDFLELLPMQKTPQPARKPPPGPGDTKDNVPDKEKNRLQDEFTRLLGDQEFDEFFDPYGTSGL
jgi:predicted RNA-binding protein with PIN domain